jgi:putative MATE family efflux protein
LYRKTTKGLSISALRRATIDRDWTKGSIFNNLMSLSWPMIVGGSLNNIGPTIDMIWVGKLGAAAIAGVGVSGMVVMLANSMLMGLFMGLRAMIARFVGAKDSPGANHIAQQAIVLGLALSVFIAAIGLFFAEPIMRLMGVSPDVVAEGVPYLRINFIGMITMSFRNMTESTMQASGDSVTPMWIAIFFRLIHIVLCPFLVFGWWIFPKMGVTGAAITSVFSQGLGASIGLWFLFSGRTRLRLTLQRFKFDLNAIWRLVRISLPASVTSMERTLGTLILMRFMAPFGTAAIAGHTLNQRVEFFLYMPAMGVGQAAGVLAGQNLGAREPERAERTGWLGVGLVAIMMTVASIAIYFWAENVIHIFNSDPTVVEMSSTFLRIAIVGFILMSFNSVLQPAINGAGDTFIPMVIMLLNMWLVQVPLAYFLSQFTSLGVYGVRWAMVAGTVSGTIFYIIYFRMGRWKRKKV